MTSGGQPIALARVDRMWEEGGVRQVSGPIEAVAHGSHKGPSARAIRRHARELGWKNVTALFPLSPPSAASQESLRIAQTIADGVVVAARANDFPAWRAFLEVEPRNSLLIQLPEDFPSENPRAELVVQKSVGASSSLLIK